MHIGTHSHDVLHANVSKMYRGLQAREMSASNLPAKLNQHSDNVGPSRTGGSGRRWPGDLRGPDVVEHDSVKEVIAPLPKRTNSVTKHSARSKERRVS